MELFNYYEEDFLELRDSIQKRLETIPSYEGGSKIMLSIFDQLEQKNYEVTLAQKDIKDAEAKVNDTRCSSKFVG